MNSLIPPVSRSALGRCLHCHGVGRWRDLEPAVTEKTRQAFKEYDPGYFHGQWQRSEHLLPGKPTDKGGLAVNNRLFVEAVLWIAHTGSPWRDLPREFGNWHL